MCLHQPHPDFCGLAHVFDVESHSPNCCTCILTAPELWFAIIIVCPFTLYPFKIQSQCRLNTVVSVAYRFLNQKLNDQEDFHFNHCCANLFLGIRLPVINNRTLAVYVNNLMCPPLMICELRKWMNVYAVKLLSVSTPCDNVSLQLTRFVVSFSFIQMVMFILDTGCGLSLCPSFLYNNV